jgi:CBS domain containing-hemolysin-like protein
MQKAELTRKLKEIIEHNSEFTTWTVSTPHLLMLVNEAIREEREACAKVAGWLWQQFQDIKEAHERNSPEPFKPECFGFDQSTVQQSKRLMDAIRARGQQ